MREYQTLDGEGSAEFTERRSRFIGYARPVCNEEEAAAFIREIKAKHWDATHNVSAFSIRSNQIRRYSDDGEPQGTAGLPALEAIQKSELTDAAVVVTRYFGGVLLGAGGLVRAYSHGASLALRAAGVITMRECAAAALACDYAQYGRLQALISECGGKIDDTRFGEAVEILFHIAATDFDTFSTALADATSGSVTASVREKKYFKFI